MPLSPTNLLVNIGSLQGQQALQRSESALAISIRNLSSGIRIHTGRDDPVGFVASTKMQTEITSLTQAVANCQKASSVIATVDSALGHVSSLINDLRALVTEAASTGGETPETLASLQVQADAIIDTINFISTSTSFQGQKLLDGSLDFTTYGLDKNTISLLKINQANFQGRTEKDIVVQVYEPARQAELYYPYGALRGDITLTIGGTGGHEAFAFDRDATVQDIANAVNQISDSTGVGATVFSKSTSGSMMLTSYGKNNDVLITASEPGTAASNFVFRYTAPREGNSELRLNVAEGNGNNPTIVEIMLQTDPGGNVLTTAEQVVTLLNTSPLLKNPDGTGRISAAHPTGSNGYGIVTPFSEVAYYGCVNENNYLQFLAPEGSPAIKFVSTPGTPLSVYETNPPVYANATAQVQGFDPDTSFTLRSLIPGTEGDNVKIIFRDDPKEKATYDPINKTLIFSVDFSGRAADPNREDFSMEDLKKLVSGNPEVCSRFSIQPHVSYSLDTPPKFSSEAYRNAETYMGTTSGGVVWSGYPNATAQVQGFDLGTSFTLRSLMPGPEGDNVKIIFRDDLKEGATYDPISKTLIFSVDFSGRDETENYFSMEDLKQLVAENHEVASRFSVLPHASYSLDDPPKFSSEAYRHSEIQMGTTSGGVVSQGYLVINLETDENGIVKTTANDLVKFFNDPSTEESKTILDRLGISVACIDPTNITLTACTIGQANFGTGLLSPTFDPCAPCPPDLKYPDVQFCSYGNDVREAFATATVSSNGGRNADWTLTANHAGAAYNNVAVKVVEGVNGLGVKYDPALKQLTVSIDSYPTGTTAAEIVELINNDQNLKGLFTASLPSHSNGKGFVMWDDRAVLTGGIMPIDARSEGSIIASGGIHSTFTVQSKRAESQYHNTEMIVVPDFSGPRVSYDAQSKQLTIGINPSNPPTAEQIVELINSTPDIRDLFSASIPSFVEGTNIVPNGRGLVNVGDFGVLQARTTGATMGAAMIGASDNESLGLMFYSTEHGSQAFVSVWATHTSEFPVVDRFGVVTEKTFGTDIVADINGRRAIGDGRTAKSATTDLDIEITTDPSVLAGDVFGFRISGGGTLMQLGPNASWTQQVRVSIPSVHSTALGGENGTLSQLKTDELFSLLKDTKQAFRIIEEAEIQVASTRGRLGALQRAQIEMSMAHMSDTITIETEARSKIADADFASGTSELARQQLLMQASVAVLQQSGQTRQLLLSLLQR